MPVQDKRKPARIVANERHIRKWAGLRTRDKTLIIYLCEYDCTFALWRQETGMESREGGDERQKVCVEIAWHGYKNVIYCSWSTLFLALKSGCVMSYRAVDVIDHCNVEGFRFMHCM